jgi:dihydroorotate dehydrogenase
MHQRYVPLVVKVSPDLTKPAVKAMAKALLTKGIDGLICSNTTTDRKAIGGSPYAQQTGGLSGAPLAAKSNKIISEFAEALQDKVPIIGVGGIVDGNSAEAKIAAGASLVQLYTGLIYRGPALIKAVYDALL